MSSFQLRFSRSESSLLQPYLSTDSILFLLDLLRVNGPIRTMQTPPFIVTLVRKSQSICIIFILLSMLQNYREKFPSSKQKPPLQGRCLSWYTRFYLHQFRLVFLGLFSSRSSAFILFVLFYRKSRPFYIYMYKGNAHQAVVANQDVAQPTPKI